MIGVGNNGHEKIQPIEQLPGAEVRVICDLYEGNLRRAMELCDNPHVATTKDYHRVLQNPDIDAVMISTPDFWHAPMTIDAAEAGKDIYVEKALCRTLPEAKAVVKAVKANNVVLQLGHQGRSSARNFRAREVYRSGCLGKVTFIRAFRAGGGNLPPWEFYTDGTIKEMPEDAGPQTIDWERFIANAPYRPFDAQRFFTWRLFLSGTLTGFSKQGRKQLSVVHCVVAPKQMAHGW